jgi:Cu+-exporting ATPase
VSIVRGSETVIAPIESLEIGDLCVVKPGERFPTDGTVIEGKSSVDNSLLTGESLPIDIAPGSAVISGAINLNGRVVIRAERIGKDTELSRITQMVLTAQTEKAPLQHLADRISSFFVPVVLVIAAGTFAMWYFSGYSLQRSIATAVAVLVIACPCALGLATPVAFLVATGRGAQRGIVLRKTGSLEIASTINTVVFDKTGTLTQGEMKVIDFTFVENRALSLNLSDLRSAVHAIESESTHPIAKAITRYLIAYDSGKLPATDFDSTTGAGVAARVRINGKELPVIIGTPDSVLRATLAFPNEITQAISRAHTRGNTISVVAVDGIAVAAIEVGDTMKPDARDAVNALHAAGIETWLITGDHESAAIELANAVGIPRERTISDARPENKVELIKKLQSEKSVRNSQQKKNSQEKHSAQQNKRVLMIGDGINDAAALVAADLSMAMGTGTDTAISSADITLMRPTLYAALDALKLSTKTLRTIKGNLLWAFLYNAIGIPIAALGLLDPMYAGAAMAGSSLFVVLNSLRIRIR